MALLKRRLTGGGLLVAATLTLGACSSDPTVPSPSDDVQIRLHVTGGLVGVDYAIVVDGATLSVLGESCVNGCSFPSGQTIMEVSRERVDGWAVDLLSAGILELAGTDYGNECCDRFYVSLTYSDGLAESTIRGTSDLMPREIQAVVGELSGLADGILPVLIDWEADPALLPGDPLGLDSLSVEGSLLELHVAYSGGCEVHQLDATLFGGWMESFPVQVRMAVSHEDNDDPCDAIVVRTLRFDLRPVEAAYAESYPGEPPGQRTLIIHLQLPGDARTETLTYEF
jgi:hypothetical protein